MSESHDRYTNPVFNRQKLIANNFPLNVGKIYVNVYLNYNILCIIMMNFL